MNREEIANPTLMEIAETTVTLASTLASYWYMNDFQGNTFQVKCTTFESLF